LTLRYSERNCRPKAPIRGPRVGLTLALAMTANQLAIVAAPVLYGLLLDAVGSYAIAWWALAAGLAMAAWRVAAADPGALATRGLRGEEV
jgi:predicted MFS family arabinose efflux permease